MTQLQFQGQVDAQESLNPNNVLTCLIVLLTGPVKLAIANRTEKRGDGMKEEG